VLAVSALTYGVNVATNSNMEESQDDEPVGWTPFDLYPGTDYYVNQVTYDGTNARSGTHSLKVEMDPTYSEHTDPGAWIQEGIVDHASNVVLESSAWVKANEPTKVRLCLYGYEPGWGIEADGAVSPIFTVGTNWTQISHMTTFATSATNVSLLLIRCAQWQGSEVWFDDVEVAAVDPADLPPEVENVDPSEITWNSATLNGNLICTGGAPAYVWIYWGPATGGTDKASWQTNAYLDARDEGAFSNKVSTLTPDITYYYRCYASNVNAGVWAEDTIQFSTVQTNEYVWTGAADQSTWANSGNWRPSSGFPDDSEDKATIPAGLTHSINTGGALTIGELDMQSGCTATIVLGGALTVSTNGGRNGEMAISNGTLFCNGQDLNVYHKVTITGTLDAHSNGDPSVTLGPLTINAGGVCSATTNTTTIVGDFENNGTFTHNGGTVKIGTGTGYDELKGTTAFYNLSVIGGDAKIGDDAEITVINLFRVSHWCRFKDNVTVNLGDATHAGELTDFASSGHFYHSGDWDSISVIGKHPTDYAVIGNDAFGWTLGIWTLSNVHYDADDTMDSQGRVGVTYSGDCKFRDLTMNGVHAVPGSSALTFDSLTLDSNGTYEVDSGTTTISGNFTNDGTFACGTGTVVFAGTGNVDNNNQAFYNLTSAAGAGNKVTLAAGTISAISNLLHVVSGTCHTDDNLSEGYTGGGTFAPLPRGANTVVCGVSPLVDSGARLEAGDIPRGSLFKLW